MANKHERNSKVHKIICVKPNKSSSKFEQASLKILIAPSPPDVAKWNYSGTESDECGLQAITVTGEGWLNLRKHSQSTSEHR
jgi:hypothetical protein